MRALVLDPWVRFPFILGWHFDRHGLVFGYLMFWGVMFWQPGRPVPHTCLAGIVARIVRLVPLAK